jgi:hypothetical protein
MGMGEGFTRDDIDRLRTTLVSAFMSGDYETWTATSQELRRYLKVAGIEKPPLEANALQKVVEHERYRLHKKEKPHGRCRCLRWRGRRDTPESRLARLYACPNPCQLGRAVADRLKTVDGPGIVGIDQTCLSG